MMNNNLKIGNSYNFTYKVSWGGVLTASSMKLVGEVDASARLSDLSHYTNYKKAEHLLSEEDKIDITNTTLYILENQKGERITVPVPLISIATPSDRTEMVIRIIAGGEEELSGIKHLLDDNGVNYVNI